MVVTFAVAQEQSDYEVTQSFQTKYKELMASIEKAQTVQDCAAITVGIDDLEKEYKPNKALLDKALYPDDFEKTFIIIRGRLAYAQNTLGLIQDQVTRIAALEAQVNNLSAQVEKLTNENGEMLKEVQSLRAQQTQDRQSLDSMKSLIAQLRENIHRRDQVIFAMVDSIFMQYDKDITQLKDVTKKSLVSHLERNNAVANIERAVSDNVAFLEATTLSDQDIASIVGEQKKFASNWKGLGPKLASTYVSSKQREKEVTTIDTMIAYWGQKADEAMWHSLNHLFHARNFAVQQFSNGTEFYNNLMAFFDDQINNTAKETKEARYNAYTTFTDSVWNPIIVKTWLSLMHDNGKLSNAQITDLNGKVAAWQATIQPPRTWWYIGLAVVMLILLIVMYWRIRKPRGVTAEE
jgi:predicted  nucleic acid-binding Zn-ribbon protein